MLEYLMPISQKTVRINLLRYALNCHESGEQFCIKRATTSLTNVIWSQEKGAALSVTNMVKFFIANGAFIKSSKGKYMVVNTVPVHADLAKWEAYYGFREKMPIPAETLAERRARKRDYDRARHLATKSQPSSKWTCALDAVMGNLGR